MAKPKKKTNKKMKARKGGKKPVRRKKKKSVGQVFGGLGLVMAIIFMASTIVLLVGMLPTVVAIFVDRTRQKNKAVTVGAMNLAGCTPFLLELWSQGHNVGKSIDIITDPMAIVVMYAAAAVGYIIDWAMTGLVAGILYDRGQKRAVAIKKKQEELVERWGKEVTGTIPLDEYGFALDAPNDLPGDAQASDKKQ